MRKAARGWARRPLGAHSRGKFGPGFDRFRQGRNPRPPTRGGWPRRFPVSLARSPDAALRFLPATPQPSPPSRRRVPLRLPPGDARHSASFLQHSGLLPATSVTPSTCDEEGEATRETRATASRPERATPPPPLHRHELCFIAPHLVGASDASGASPSTCAMPRPPPHGCTATPPLGVVDIQVIGVALKVQFSKMITSRRQMRSFKWFWETCCIAHLRRWDYCFADKHADLPRRRGQRTERRGRASGVRACRDWPRKGIQPRAHGPLLPKEA
ncbi:hypothetical protein EJB05_46072, partial [Eragrostis curvula]